MSKVEGYQLNIKVNQDNKKSPIENLCWIKIGSWRGECSKRLEESNE